MIPNGECPDADSRDNRSYSASSAGETMKLKPSIFVYGDENFSEFEILLKSWSFCTREIWRLRVDIHQLLVGPLLADQRQRFKYSFLSYIPWLVRDIYQTTRRHPEITIAPDTKFLILICGTASKEFEILAPIVRSLLDQGNSVGIAWFTSAEIPEDVRASVNGAQIWQIRSGELWSTAGFHVIGDAFNAIWRWIMLALRLGMEPQGARTLWQQSARLVDRFIELRVTERFLSRKLSRLEYAGIGLASDTSAVGAALARVCLRRGWPSHHFLHGLPDLIHARSLATDLYCYSRPEADFFMKNGCSPEHVFACGHPSQARTSAEVARLRNQKPEEGGLRLLYAAQSAFGSFDAAMNEEMATTVIEAAKRLSLTKDEFRIRIHPADDPRIIRAIAASILGEQYDGYMSTGTVAEDLAWANVLTTLHSTMAFQATYVDVQVVWLFALRFRYGIRDALMASGFGHETNNLNELIDTFSLLRDDAHRKKCLERFRIVARDQAIISIDPAGVCAKSMQNF